MKEGQRTTTPQVLGISGGIGSGKSVFSRLLSFFDIPVFDSDREAKLLYGEGEVKDFVSTHFGTEFYATSDGSLNRKAFAQLIFSRPEARALVESFIHPLVKKRFELFRERQQKRWIGLESAILFPSGLDVFCNAVVWIEAPLEERIKRIALRDKATEEEIIQRIKAQEGISPKEQSIPLFKVNNSACSPLLPQIRNLLESLNTLFEQGYS